MHRPATEAGRPGPALRVTGLPAWPARPVRRAGALHTPLYGSQSERWRPPAQDGREGPCSSIRNRIEPARCCGRFWIARAACRRPLLLGAGEGGEGRPAHATWPLTGGVSYPLDEPSWQPQARRRPRAWPRRPRRGYREERRRDGHPLRQRRLNAIAAALEGRRTRPDRPARTRARRDQNRAEARLALRQTRTAVYADDDLIGRLCRSYPAVFSDRHPCRRGRWCCWSSTGRHAAACASSTLPCSSARRTTLPGVLLQAAHGRSPGGRRPPVRLRDDQTDEVVPDPVLIDVAPPTTGRGLGVTGRASTN